MVVRVDLTSRQGILADLRLSTIVNNLAVMARLTVGILAALEDLCSSKEGFVSGRVCPVCTFPFQALVRTLRTSAMKMGPSLTHAFLIIFFAFKYTTATEVGHAICFLQSINNPDQPHIDIQVN